MSETDENNNCVISYEEDPYENDAEYKALRQKAQNEVIRRATERTYTKKDIDLAIQAAHKALRIEKTNDDGDFVSIEYIYRFLDIERQDYLYHTEEELEKIALKCYEI